MYEFKVSSGSLPRFMVMLLVLLATACGGGGSGQDSILSAGGGVSNPVAPTVTGTINTNGQTGVSINTKVGATFSVPMDPSTITPANFSLKQTLSGVTVTGTISYSGVSAVFTPAASLLPTTGYTVTIKSGAGGVKNLAGTPMASDFVISWTTGTTPETTPPNVSGTINANGATNVAVNTRIGASFSEGMNATTITSANFTVKQTASGTPVVGVVSYSGVNVVFTPASNLVANTAYSITVKGGVGGVADLADNVMIADFVWSWTTGAAPDTTPPIVTATINANGAINVPINTKIGATFSEALDPLTITNTNFLLKQTVSAVAVVGTVSYSGVTAVLIPVNALSPGINYTLTLKGGSTGVKDLAGNVLASDYTWSWTTSQNLDITAPFVIDTINDDGAINVPVNTKIGASFSEAIDPLTVTTANFFLRQKISGAAVTGTISYAGTNAVFDPLNPLVLMTAYTATVKGGSAGVKDLAGNPMTGDFVWTWTTSEPDTTPPSITVTSPVAGRVGVASNSFVTAIFSEAMDPLTITAASFTLACPAGAVATATVRYAANSKIAILTPAKALPVGTTCSATVTTDAKDLAGNSLPLSTWSFTTGTATDSVAPSVTRVSPTAGATGVALNSVITAAFSEEMDPSDINGASFTVACPVGTPISGRVTYVTQASVASFIPFADLPSTTCQASLGAGISDIAGNLLPASTWIFTTGLAVPIVIVPIVPIVPAAGPAPVNLRTAGNFVALAKTGISSTGATTIVGNIGVSPAAATFITNFALIADVTNTFSTSSQVTGKVYAANYAVPTPATMTTAIADMQTAYTDAAGRTSPDFTELHAGDVSGRTLVPGLYKWSTGVLITNAGVTLTGGANDVWIFQIAGNLTVNNSAIVTLSGGAQAKNVFWQVAGQATLGTTANFKGIILSQTLISLDTGASMTGRALAQTAVTLNAATTLTQP